MGEGWLNVKRMFDKRWMMLKEDWVKVEGLLVDCFENVKERLVEC